MREGNSESQGDGDVKRPLLIVAVFLLAGAVVNVAVAWGCSKFSEPGGPTNSAPSAEDEAWLVGIAPLPRWQHWEAFDLTTFTSFGYKLRIVTARVWVEDGPNVTKGAIGVRRVVGWPGASVQLSIVQVQRDKSGTRVTTDHAVGRFRFPWRSASGFDILWAGFAINTAFYAAVLCLLTGGSLVLRTFIRLKRGLCPACAYPRGESDVCSECGKPFPNSRASRHIIV